MNAKDVMTTDLVTCTPKASLSDVAQKMLDADTGVIPIIDNGRLAGLVTDRDLAVRGLANGKDAGTQVREVMSQDLVCCDADADLHVVAKLMHDRQVKRICITEGDNLLGIISLGDLAVTVEDDAEEALEGISHGAKAESHAPTQP